jgi:hypothetical protein
MKVSTLSILIAASGSLILGACGGSVSDISSNQNPGTIQAPSTKSPESPPPEKEGKKLEKTPDKEPAKLATDANSRDMTRAHFDRGTYLRKRPIKSQADSFIEKYGRARLDKAATIKRYSPITIMPVQLEAHCSTAWDRGMLHVRVAYLGPPHNLSVFMKETRMIYVTFQDEYGANVYNFEVPIEQFEKAPETMNYGTPTYQVEGQLPLALENYERFFQWSCEWH